MKSTKIAAAVMSVAMLASAVAAPASNIAANLIDNTTLSASAARVNDIKKQFVDSTGNWYVYLDAENGKSTKATIAGYAKTVPSRLLIPYSVTVTGKDFNNKEFTVSVPVTEIRCNCITSDNLTSLVIPSSVTYIGIDAFKNCKNLKDLTFQGKAFGLSSFQGCTSLKTINGVTPYMTDYKTGEPIFKDNVKDAIMNEKQDLSCFAFMNDYADAYYKYVAQSVAGQTTNETHKAKLLHDWLATRLNDNPSTSTAYKDSRFCAILDGGNHKATSQGYAEAYKALMNAAGIETCVVKSNSSNSYWNACNINKNTYHVDVYWDDFPYTIYYTRFMKNDAEFEAIRGSHDWASYTNLGTSITTRSTKNLGDLNGDGKITDADATMLQEYKVGTRTLSPTARYAADVDMDGQIALNDAVIIRQYIARVLNQGKSTSMFDYEFIQ